MYVDVGTATKKQNGSVKPVTVDQHHVNYSIVDTEATKKLVALRLKVPPKKPPPFGKSTTSITNKCVMGIIISVNIKPFTLLCLFLRFINLKGLTTSALLTLVFPFYIVRVSL